MKNIILQYPEDVPEMAVYNPRGLGEEEINKCVN
jgi:hypothetical protein